MKSVLQGLGIAGTYRVLIAPTAARDVAPLTPYRTVGHLRLWIVGDWVRIADRRRH